MTFSSIRMTFAAALLFGVVAGSLSLLMPSSGVQANTLVVTNNADSGPGSLRQAIVDAIPGDTITFDVSLDGQTITLTGGALTINKNLTVVGPFSGIIVSGNDASRVFVVTGAVDVDVTGVHVTHGSTASYGGGIQVLNGANLTLADGSITDSRVTASYGGAISVWENSTATLNNVEVSGNTSAGYASGFHVWGTLNLTNVTISGNGAAFSGTALMMQAGPDIDPFSSVANLVNVTISNNSSPHGVLNEAVDVSGGGPDGGTATLNLTNTIVAEQAMGGDCAVGPGGTINSLGHNIDSDGSCDLGGTGDMSNANPTLGPLALRAPGTTRTHSLGAGSPAIDNGDDVACPLADQRGVSRPLGLHCDIGAYERVPHLIQGDVDCNGDANAVDALKVLRYVAQLAVSQTHPCPAIGANVVSIWGDVDCKGEPTAVDALAILRYVAGLSVQQTDPCPDLGVLIPGG